MYGTQTLIISSQIFVWFENDVKMYGTQTTVMKCRLEHMFENDVKMYGTQTGDFMLRTFLGLRMM